VTDNASAILEARDVSFSYSADVPALSRISLSIQPGEIVALIGPNGSGKSTLIRSLFGALRAGGSIKWDMKDLRKWRRRDLAKFVAYLAQSPAYDPDQTVADVLRLGRSAYWGVFGIESDADLVRVGEVANRLNLNDLLDRPMSDLSGGQRQRVFVGRCLVQQPRAMLLDEPNTYLDLKHQIELGKLIRELSRQDGIGVLMASHDLNLAGMFADRLILLSRGTVAASGSASDVLQPELLRQVYDIDMQRIDREDLGFPLVIPRV
jgi:iron complex transport system ATP-binding protein